MATFRYVRLLCVATVFILGSITAYDIIVGDDVPPIANVYPPRQLSTAQLYDSPELAENFDETRAWESLQPALQILDVVCPEASAWAREQHDSDKLIWKEEPDGNYASFNPYNRCVTINSDMFVLNNSERACTIAHEFRHSRQNISKFIKSSCCFVITGKRNPDIVENDAYLYESQVRSAIYGR